MQITAATDEASRLAQLQGCMQQLYRRGAAGERLIKAALQMLLDFTDSKHGYVAMRRPKSEDFVIFCVADRADSTEAQEGRRLTAADFAQDVFREGNLPFQAVYTEKIIDIQILARHAREKMSGGHLSVPVFVGEHLVGVIGLLGKEVPYDTTDIHGTELVMGYALAVGRVRQLEAADTKETDLRNIFELTSDGMAVIDPQREEITHANSHLCRMLGLTGEELVGRPLADFAWAVPGGYDLHRVKRLLDQAMQRGGEPLASEWLFRRSDGKDVWTRLQMKKGYIGEKEFIFASICDIGEQKQMQEKLSLITEHDPLTGLFNRAVFDRYLANQGFTQSVGLLLCDIDGLRLINEGSGDHAGDALLVALGEFLQELTRPEADMVFRLGGGMFALLQGAGAPYNVRQLAKKVQRFAAGCSNVAGFSISAAALELVPQDDLSRKLRLAEEMLYRQKMHCERSEKSGVAQMLTRALATRDNITGGHADRMEEMCVALLRNVVGEEAETTDMRLFAKFHDIGKIGIPDDLLFKPGKLLPEEYEQMKLHSKLGANIARASSALAPIADLILMHHERWDGQGYPLGKKGREIPLECRILSVVDAYDAMTSDRPYRRAIDEQAARNELFLHAGTQFDPDLVERFVAMQQERKLASGDMEQALEKI